MTNTTPSPKSTARRSLQILSQVEVAKPCPASWRDMTGDDRVRLCTHCAKNVYNISSMSRDEAADLIESTEGRVCIRYYTRPDGSIMTRDCGKSPRKSFRFMAMITTVLTAIGLGSIASAWQGPNHGRPIHGYPIMGRMAAPHHTMGTPAIRYPSSLTHRHEAKPIQKPADKSKPSKPPKKEAAGKPKSSS